MADIIDQGVVNKDMGVFVSRGLGMLACALLSLATGLLYARFAAKSSTKLGQLLRDKQFARIQRFSFTNLDCFETSGIVTRMTSDVTVVQNAITSGLRPLARGPIMLVLGLVMSFLINAELAFVFFSSARCSRSSWCGSFPKSRPSIRACKAPWTRSTRSCRKT